MRLHAAAAAAAQPQYKAASANAPAEATRRAAAAAATPARTPSPRWGAAAPPCPQTTLLQSATVNSCGRKRKRQQLPIMMMTGLLLTTALRYEVWHVKQISGSGAPLPSGKATTLPRPSRQHFAAASCRCQGHAVAVQRVQFGAGTGWLRLGLLSMCTVGGRRRQGPHSSRLFCALCTSPLAPSLVAGRHNARSWSPLPPPCRMLSPAVAISGT